MSYLGICMSELHIKNYDELLEYNYKKLLKNNSFLFCVPGMALILLVKVQSRVFTAKCSKPQAVNSNVMGEGRG